MHAPTSVASPPRIRVGEPEIRPARWSESTSSSNKRVFKRTAYSVCSTSGLEGEASPVSEDAIGKERDPAGEESCVCGDMRAGLRGESIVSYENCIKCVEL